WVEGGGRREGGKVRGRGSRTGGVGGMGGAQPLAAVMAGASMLAVECAPSRIERRLETRYLDRKAATLEEAMEIIRAAHAKGEAGAGGRFGHSAEVIPGDARPPQAGPAG